MKISSHIEILRQKGVAIPQPFAVDIGTEVNVSHISGDGVVFYPGTKIYGADTVISSGVKLGYEGPATIENCKLGSSVELRGGFFRNSVFLEGCSLDSGAHVREGCLLEEETKAGHTVGLKQTILFPFVTLGSLINFCDCFMAGGTDRKNHSEVGSSYIHFNYTPQQDKATASLIGDVPRGVMLRQKPIFLGGQGGLVGPARIGFGTVIAAGVVFRGDCPEGEILISGVKNDLRDRPFHCGLYSHMERRIHNNLIYLANLLALKQWYSYARRPFYQSDTLGQAVYQGALKTLEGALQERLKRLDGLAEKMDGSLAQVAHYLKGQQKKRACQEQESFRNQWPVMRSVFLSKLEESLGIENRRQFLVELDRTASTQGQYLSTIKALSPTAIALGERWLQEILDGITDRCTSVLRGETGNQ